ncbi:MAG: flagellar M-ring protein FliF [Azoarcus sp.]|jgi:flagellar M-ring protein FliF|nr:flagellar M-ring protein FliF [Azoarcus sp.]
MAAAENTADDIALQVSTDEPTAPADAPTAYPPNSLRGRLQQARTNIAALSQRQRIAALAALALAIAIIVAVFLWSRPPSLGVLFSNFDNESGGEVIAALQQQNVPFSVSGDGRSILVPAGIVYETRMRLAAAGVPKGGQVGFELMDTQKLGVSQFNEQVTYQRALEGELARTIQALSAVTEARVHLAMPKQTSFLRDDQKPTAAVGVRLRPGRTLDDNQLAGIVHLIASAVPKMQDSGVSVTDLNSGNLLTGEEQKRRSDLDPMQLRYVEEVEAKLIQRVEHILTPLYGKDNFRAQVAADIDFNKVEQTAETYRPNPAPEQAIRSQQTNEMQGRDTSPQGVPGALTNQPPVPATAPITLPPVPPQLGANSPQTSSRSATLNYELDRTIQHTQQSLGQIKRLTVAVVFNYRAPPADADANAPQPAPTIEDEITRVTSLVRDAVGYNAARGDTITVDGRPFADTSAPEVPLWKDPQVVEMGLEGGKYLGYALLLLFIYLAIIRPLMRTIAPPPREEPTLDAKSAAGGEGEEGAEGSSEAEGEEENVELSIAGLRSNDFDTRLERARQIARDDPKNVAELVKQWLGVNEEGVH